jgi:hypothetical protein
MTIASCRTHTNTRILSSRLAWRMVDVRTTDPVQYADLRTSLADVRTALCLARGVDPADITSLGTSISRDAYERSRASWVRMYAEDSSEWTIRGAHEARTAWTRRRPDWTDDWGIPLATENH